MAHKKTAAEVFADNLKTLMGLRGFVQKTLAAESGVAQTTISNYLDPERRTTTKNGKPGSPNLANVDLLAAALKVEAWVLLHPSTGAERDVIHAVAAALAAKVPDGAAPVAAKDEAPKPRRIRRASAVKKQKRA